VIARRVVTTAVIALGLAACGRSRASEQPAPRANPVVDSILTLDRAWARSYATHDTALAMALFDRELSATSSAGVQKGWAGELADVRPQAGLTMHYFRTTNAAVKLHERTAIVTGIAEWSFTFNGRQNALRRSYTTVWLPGGPLGWRMVALHLGAAPGP
jgi:hypothetical protein